jgi:3-oxoacyl-[acyl-carrier protein] reductase
MNDSTCFREMTALVTGASSGIGAATALALGARGAAVQIHYNCQKEAAAAVLRRVRESGGDGALVQADLSIMDGLRSLTRQMDGRIIDILVNNAGSLIRRTPVLDLSEELWEQMMMLNLSSTFFLTKAILPCMVARKRGFVVNISSVAARTGGGLGALAYAAAKGAVSTMTKSLATEFAPLGVRINAVSPGTVDTNYHRHFSDEQMLSAVRSATPLRRIGTSEEIADVIVFLCTEQARFIHGQVIEVNGGFLMA